MNTIYEKRLDYLKVVKKTSICKANSLIISNNMVTTRGRLKAGNSRKFI